MRVRTVSASVAVPYMRGYSMNRPTKNSNWKITIAPHRAGTRIRVRTVAAVQDEFADRLSRFIERSLAVFCSGRR
jgi:hypothetical protein